MYNIDNIVLYIVNMKKFKNIIGKVCIQYPQILFNFINFYILLHLVGMLYNLALV